MATKKKFAPRLAKVEAKPDPVVDLGLRFLGAIEDDEMLRRYIDTKARDLTMDKRARGDDAARTGWHDLRAA